MRLDDYPARARVILRILGEDTRLSSWKLGQVPSRRTISEAIDAGEITSRQAGSSRDYALTSSSRRAALRHSLRAVARDDVIRAVATTGRLRWTETETCEPDTVGGEKAIGLILDLERRGVLEREPLSFGGRWWRLADEDREAAA